MATAAELLARIGVQGVNEFTSDLMSASNAFNAFGNVVQSAIHAVELAMVAGAGAFAAYTEDALKHAARIESYTATFGAVTHSMDMGRQMMAYYRQEAANLNDTFEDMAPNLLRLQAVGLNPGAFMKTIDSMGKILSPDNQSAGVRQAAEMFERAMAQPNRLAIPMRTARNMGITNQDLEQQGIQISAAGHINATADQWINAVVNTFKTKYSDVNEFLENSLSRKFSNLTDAWNHMLEKWGAGFAPLAGRILDAITPFMQFLANSGEIEKIAASFAALMGGLSNGQGFIRVFAYGLAILEEMPGMLKQAGGYIGDIFMRVAGGLDAIAKYTVGVVNDIILAINGIRPLLNILSDVVVEIAHAVQLVKAFNPLNMGTTAGNIATQAANFVTGKPVDWNAMNPFREANDIKPLNMKGGLDEWVKSLPGAFGAAGRNTSSIADKIMADFNKSLTMTANKATNPEGEGLFLKDKNAAETEQLQKIERNTATVAAHMESFKRYALGGGDRGQVGVTVAEMYGRSTAGGTVRLETGKAGSLFEQGAAQVARDYHQSIRRAGLGGN